MIKERRYKYFLAGGFLFVLFAIPTFAQSNCARNALVIKPRLNDAAEKRFKDELQKAYQNHALAKAENAVGKINPSPLSDAIIWIGRRRAYLGEYKKAISKFTDGIKSHPEDARFYRHRGHRYITLRCFDDAIKDFETAAKLIKGKPDEIETDGLPNLRNIPTSTLQSNIWYHLGLAYYLKGDFKNALRAYKECLKVSKNPDMLVATVNWLFVTQRRLGETNEAEESIAAIGDDLDIIENDGYYKLIKVYQGKIKAEDLLNEIGKSGGSLNDASVGYGLGNWYLINGESEKAKKIFREITSGEEWSSFGFIAAEAELKR